MSASTIWIRVRLRLALTVLLFSGASALAQAVRLSGVIRDADTGTPIRNAQVKLEGAALAGRENSQAIARVNAQGAYRLEVPPGDYQLWIIAPDYEEVGSRWVVTPGQPVDRDFELGKQSGAGVFKVETLPLPRAMIPEVSGVAFTPQGTLVVTNRRGEVWMRNAAGAWRRFATGLYEGFGLVAPSETEILVIQRPELTRLRDTDGDGVADRYETMADQWGITGNYHEFTYGLARDRKGNVYFGSGMVSYGRGREIPWARGDLKAAQYIPWAGPGNVPDGHRSVAPMQGWMFQVSAAGQFTPFAFGFRQPLGVGVSPDDELFVSDVSGAWVPTSTLLHVEKDGFYGHPDPLKWHPDYQDRKLSVEELRALRRPPTVYLPRGLMGTSPGQPVWDTTGGKFGPYAGQIFLGDVTPLLMRVDLEKVAGVYQGAAFPFLRGGGLRLGGMHNTFGPDGALYVAQTVRGWMSTEGNEGLQRVVWSGETPVDLLSVKLTAQGFALRYTTAMNVSIGEVSQYQVKRFHYNYHPLDGSLRVSETDVPVTRVQASADGLGVEVELLELQPGFVYELNVGRKVLSRTGRPLANAIAYYTANRLLSGETKPGPSRLQAAAAQVARPPDPGRGEEIFRLNCVACHMPDGKGSKQIGTPDYTAAESPLQKPDHELLAIIAGGKNQMPAFGNVLPAQSIADVVAYLRQAYQPKRAGR
jgi:mono/diheme cytochrome c family protein